MNKTYLNNLYIISILFSDNIASIHVKNGNGMTHTLATVALNLV